MRSPLDSIVSTPRPTSPRSGRSSASAAISLGLSRAARLGRLAGWLLLAVLTLSGLFGSRVAFAQPRPGATAAPADPPPAAAPPAGSAAPAAPPPGGAAAPGAAPGDDAGLEAPEVEIPPSEAELARGLRISKVTFVGNQRIPPEEIEAYLQRTRVGRTFDPEGLASDVKEMWKSLYFEDIQVDLVRRDAEVTLRFIVRERASIKSFEWNGNKAIDSEDLEEALSVEVKKGSIFSYSAMRRGIQKLRDKYAEEGFFLAEIDYESLPQKNNQVIVKFNVRELQEVTVRRISFIGNHSVSDDELRDIMITGHSSFFDFGSGGAFRANVFERDVLVMTALYYDRGFLGVQISAPRVNLTPDRTGVEIVIPVSEGPRFKVRNIRVYERDADGNEVEPIGGRKALRDTLREHRGEWFNRAAISRDIGKILTMYRDQGYASAEAPMDTVLHHDTNEVDLVIPIKRGKLVYFGRIEIRGNTKTRDKVIRREMEIEERKLFSETLLERSRRRIGQLGYFDRVDVATEQADDDETININVDVVEKPTGTFQIGAGFSSIESFVFTAQVQQQNVFGTGQAFALNAQLTGLRQQIDLTLAEPYLFDSRFSGVVRFYDQLRVYDGFSQNSLGASLTIGYPLVDPELQAYLTYTFENNDISTSTTSTFFGTASAVSVYRKLPLANLFDDGITSSIRPSIAYDSRNNRQFPTEGVYLNASIEVAPNFLGSENQYYKLRGTARFYYPITESIIFRVNSESGLVTSPDPEGVPIYSRFWLGGIYDLRGFRLRTVGARLPLRDSLDENALPILNGQPIGGNLMYYQNVEIEFPILEVVQLRGVVFTDLGNTWNLEPLYCDAAASSPDDVTNPCFGPASIFDVRTSWGFGIRWISPLGPLRFEWGFPFKPLPYEEGSVFEFTIGNFF